MKEDPTKTQADIAAAQVGAQTGGAQAGAGQATQGAAATTGAAQSGSGVQSQGALGQVETVSDIGQGEAAIIAQSQIPAQQIRQNAFYDAVLADEFARRARLATDYDSAIRSLNLITLQNAQVRSNDQNIQASHDSVRANDNAATMDKAMDQITLMALSENPTFQDAIAAKVAAKLKPA